MDQIRYRCETCQEEATVHIEVIGCHFCASCLQKIDARIADINRTTPAENYKMRIKTIEMGRLYNLGSYEHVSYKLTVEVAEGESPSTALLGLEKILTALSPRTSTRSRIELEREKHRVEEMRHALAGKGEDEFRRNHGQFVGTPDEYIARVAQSHAENVAERDAWEARSAKARKLLDGLGGAADWKDAKLDWENDDF